MTGDFLDDKLVAMVLGSNPGTFFMWRDWKARGMVEDPTFVLNESTLSDMLERARWNGEDAESLIDRFRKMGELEKLEVLEDDEPELELLEAV